MKIKNLLPEKNILGDPITFHGLGIIPVLSDSDADMPAITFLDNALGKGEVKVSEISESDQVPYFIVENTGKHPLLILDGEELVGGKQNRIVNTSILILAGLVVKIPVSCVEAGRWDNHRYDFDSGKAIFRAKSRAVQKESVTASLRAHGTFQSDQRSVWNEVGESLCELGIDSATSDFRAGREVISHLIEEFVQAVRPVEGQIGGIFLGPQGILGCEVLASPDLFARSVEKIVRSFAFEVLSAAKYDAAICKGFMDWWERILEADFTRHRSPGEGEDIRLDAEGLVGSGLLWRDTLLQFSCFPAAESNRRNNRPSSPRANASERRDRMRNR